MKEKTINISGITCMSCVSKIEKSLYSNPAIKQVAIDQATGLATLKGTPLPHTDIIENLIESVGNYYVNATSDTPHASSTDQRSYKPLAIIVFYLLGTTLLIAYSDGVILPKTWMANFMAGFFLVFSFFKMLDIPAFASAYQSYDIIAAKVKWYGYLYPFIELALGIAYLLYSDNSITHLITAIVMFVSLVGVVRSVVRKSETQCACLGTVFNLPMSYVTIVEDGIMLAMALLMHLV
ncbi:MAG: cation transporter [Bacteroidia bacterium]|jgi:copper chaperone CopZ|nr:cation transporter [Bacteroidia bacterium]